MRVYPPWDLHQKSTKKNTTMAVALLLEIR
jgi:hypothetical protein